MAGDSTSNDPKGCVISDPLRNARRVRFLTQSPADAGAGRTRPRCRRWLAAVPVAVLAAPEAPVNSADTLKQPYGIPIQVEIDEVTRIL